MAELEKLREAQTQLLMQGIQPDTSAAQFPLLTAKMSSKEVAELKSSFPRQGFVAEVDSLEGEAKKFAAELGSKQAASPSASWKLIAGAPPEVVLWVAYSTKSAALQAKFKSFFTEWPQARLKLPYAVMQEMRIVPDVPAYNDLLEKLFFELMDGKLGTPEEMKAFLEPYSPPAPPPAVHLRRPRAKKDTKGAKSRKKVDPVEDLEGVELPEEPTEEANGLAEGLDTASPVSDNAVLERKTMAVKPVAAKAAAPAKSAPLKDAVPAKTATKASPAKTVPAKTVAKKAVVLAKTVAKVATAKKIPGKGPVSRPAPGKKAEVVAKTPAKKVATKVPAKPTGKTPAKKAVAKAPVKTAAKNGAKAPAKRAPKSAAKAGANVAAKAVAKTKAPPKAPLKASAKKKR
jgi:hypothetical protein